MNFLVIVADDLGWNDVGYHKSEIQTPNLDNLAYSGCRFEQFYSHPVCTPSRAALLTGQFPYRTGTQTLFGCNDNRGMRSDVLTLPQHLKNNGYSTYLIGKWHLGNRFQFLPTNRGFDYFCGCTTGIIEHYWHEWEKLLDFRRNLQPLKFPNAYHTTDVYADDSINILKNHDKNKPFYLQLCFNAPHIPLDTWLFNDWYWYIKDDIRKRFAALVTHMDFQIGRIIRTLRELNLYEDTIIWFVSDNGGWLGSGGNNYPLRGGKLTFYEGGLRVPSFVSSKQLNSGIFNNRCHMVDIFPTICSLAKLNVPDGLDGKNIFDTSERDHIYFLAKNDTQLVGSIRSGDWKFNKLTDIKLMKDCNVWYFDPAQAEGSELFNIKEDPEEKQNLFRLRLDMVNELLNKLIDCSCNYFTTSYKPAKVDEGVWGDVKEETLMLGTGVSIEKDLNNLDLYSISLETIVGNCD